MVVVVVGEKRGPCAVHSYVFLLQERRMGRGVGVALLLFRLTQRTCGANGTFRPSHGKKWRGAHERRRGRGIRRGGVGGGGRGWGVRKGGEVPHRGVGLAFQDVQRGRCNEDVLFRSRGGGGGGGGRGEVPLWCGGLVGGWGWIGRMLPVLRGHRRRRRRRRRNRHDGPPRRTRNGRSLAQCRRSPPFPTVTEYRRLHLFHTRRGRRCGRRGCVRKTREKCGGGGGMGRRECHTPTPHPFSSSSSSSSYWRRRGKGWKCVLLLLLFVTRRMKTMNGMTFSPSCRSAFAQPYHRVRCREGQPRHGQEVRGKAAGLACLLLGWAVVEKIAFIQ